LAFQPGQEDAIARPQGQSGDFLVSNTAHRAIFLNIQTKE
jgi:hypothetical protein